MIDVSNVKFRFVRLRNEASSATQRAVKELCEQVMTARNRAMRRGTKERDAMHSSISREHSQSHSRVRFQGAQLSANAAAVPTSSMAYPQPAPTASDDGLALDDSADELGLKSSDLEFAGIDSTAILVTGL